MNLNHLISEYNRIEDEISKLRNEPLESQDYVKEFVDKQNLLIEKINKKKELINKLTHCDE